MNVLVVIGLGNPGPRYANTRHNAGFMCLDRLARRLSISLRDKRKQALLGEGWLNRHRVVLLKPGAFMNLSGEAARYALDRYHAQPSRMLVILDDLDLPIGAVRLRASGGSGGHNGLNSINDSLGSTDYPRLRIGVGRPPGDAISHVLATFNPDELPTLDAALERATDAAEAWLRYGVDYAMNHFNAQPQPKPAGGEKPDA